MPDAAAVPGRAPAARSRTLSLQTAASMDYAPRAERPVPARAADALILIAAGESGCVSQRLGRTSVVGSRIRA